MYRLLVSGGVFGLLLQVMPITCLVGGGYAIYRCIRIKNERIPITWGNEIIRWLFVCYLTGFINLTLVPGNLWSHIWALVFAGHSQSEIMLFTGEFNFVPIIIKVLSNQLTLGSWVKTMLIGNVLMLIPLGFFLPFVSTKINNQNVFKIAVIVPVAVEIIQPVVGRSFDVDDLILNFIGIILGYFAATAINYGRLKRKHYKMNQTGQQTK